MCLARVLIHKKLIRADQKVAILLTDITDPGIMVVEKGIVQFVRDFQLQNPTMNMAPLDMDMLRKKLFNEIKISLDFYIRQFKSEKIEELFTLSFSSQDDLTPSLQKELELNVKKINPQLLGKFSMPPDAGLVSAHGGNIISLAKLVDFNLSGTIPKVSQSAKIQEQIPEEFIPAIKVGVVCVAILAIVFFLTKLNVSNYKKKYEAIVEIQGPFVEMKPEEIESRISENQRKLQHYKKAFLPSELSYLLTHIAKNLPGGMWFTKIELKYERNKAGASTVVLAGNGISKDDDPQRPMIIELSGYAYTDDPNEQFKMVYAFVNLLKSDQILKKYARSANLSGVQSEQNSDHVVTSFKILIK